MKIRTNFVTNSSSYSSAEIKIDNPVLLEILKKYEEKGAFEGTILEYDRIGVNAKEEREREFWGCYPWTDDEEELKEREEELAEVLKGYEDKDVALFYYNDESAEVDYSPENIEDVIGCLLRMLDYENGYLDSVPPLFDDFKSEILNRVEEINENFVDVIWKARNNSFGESAPAEGEQIEWEYRFKK